MKKKIDLEDLERKDIFTPPEGYFDKLPNRIQARIGLQEQKDDRPVYKLVPKKLYYIAASVAVFLIATILMLRTPQETTSVQNILVEMSTEDMIEYLEMSDVSVTEITLEEEEQQQLLENQWQNLTIPDEYVNEITTEELNEFL
jgi:hypothetical protein